MCIFHLCVEIHIFTISTQSNQKSFLFLMYYIVREEQQITLEEFSTPPSTNEFPTIPDFSLPDVSSKAWSHIYQHNPIQVQIHFTLTKPQTGVFFRSNPTPHVYTWNSFFAGKQEESLGNGTRTWLPCIDNELERCLWELEITVPSSYTVRASGDLQHRESYD